MKAGKENHIPLSPRAVAILEATELLCTPFQFAGNRGKRLLMMIAMLLRRMKAEVTVHGFRSTFRDWSAECTG
jgi:integrase